MTKPAQRVAAPKMTIRHGARKFSVVPGGRVPATRLGNEWVALRKPALLLGDAFTEIDKIVEYLPALLR